MLMVLSEGDGVGLMRDEICRGGGRKPVYTNFLFGTMITLELGKWIGLYVRVLNTYSWLMEGYDVWEHANSLS